jgi:hypothetical protein
MPINPNDPCMTIFDLEEGGEDSVPFEIADGFRHRAAVQRRFAEEMGLEFGDVRCQRGYIVIHTWAEVWEESTDQANQIEDAINDLELGDWRLVHGADDFGNEIYWEEDEEGRPWSHEVIQEQFGQMPSEWHPDFIWGAYSTVDYLHSKARPVWVCSVM